MIIFLKRMRESSRNPSGRITAIILASMQITAPILAAVINMLTLCQEKNMFNMLKQYVAIGLIINLDNFMTQCLPKECLENVERLNKSEVIKMPEDHNSTFKVLKRQFKDNKALKSPAAWFYMLLNIVINLWAGFLINFKIVILNYFGHFFVIIIQVFGYFYLNNNETRPINF